MKEIGGYFGVEQLKSNNGEYYNTSCLALNTARNALVYLVKKRRIDKIFIPYYLCDSVSLVCDREGIRYDFYNTNEEFRPVFDKPLGKNEYLYVVNLYGQIENDELLLLKNKHKRIIADNIHAFYQEPVAGVDTIYSCRKFFGVPDGAYLVSDCGFDIVLEKDNSDDRTKHIYGRIKDGASAHYAEYRANDESFESLPLRAMSDLTHRFLSEIDYNAVKKIREENFNFLHDRLGKYNRLLLHSPKGPYAYPFYVENGPVVRKALAGKKIYVATLWPNVKNVPEQNFAENILPLPCDQRYGKDDMKTIVEELLRCMRI